MGIKGLLPVLKPAFQRKHLSEYSQKCIAIDGFGLLHRAVYTCPKELCLQQPTSLYLEYCLKFLHTLQSHNIKPFVVFDGAPLPSKQVTTELRQIRRTEATKTLTNSVEKEGESTPRKIYAAAAPITSLMLARVIHLCQKLNISYLCSPFETDAQVAHLFQKGLIDGVLGEDSDFIIWRLPLVLLKYDGKTETVDEYHSSRLYLTPLGNYSFNSFLEIAILAGCDYCTNPRGVGIKTAMKLREQFDSMGQVLQHLIGEGKIDSIYIQSFLKAFVTFHCMIVYDYDDGHVPFQSWSSVFDLLHELIEGFDCLSDALKELDFNRDVIPSFCGSVQSKSIADDIGSHVVSPYSLQPVSFDPDDDVDFEILKSSNHEVVQLLLPKIFDSEN
ncbi:hypothetical protein GEMRC1_009022 [Eukaryota sp. GEM-RC1]